MYKNTNYSNTSKCLAKLITVIIAAVGGYIINFGEVFVLFGIAIILGCLSLLGYEYTPKYLEREVDVDES